MATLDRRNPPPSPCTFVCVINRASDLCMGCLRTLDEIAAWDSMTPEEKWDVMDAVARRRAAGEGHDKGSRR